MSNLTQVLRDEIRRLARREINAEIKTLKKQTTQQRHAIAELKRTVNQLRQQTGFLEKQERRRVVKPIAPTEADVRFSPGWLRTHRAKIDFSQAEYAALVGVSPLSIYNWEQERTRPRSKQLVLLASVRKLGKREARRRLDLLSAK